ncbi:hypothetical protein MMC31_003774 [Peltigera leucophlebia]|nr:hypothetical protein [Peltigera leucophlebia]
MIERVVTVVLGSQFGNEGKGNLVDILSDTAEVCARCQGGNNAGHTILASGIKYDCYLLPTGNKSVGTTHKGIGPTYSSKASRNGLRIGKLRLESWDLFEVRFRQLMLSYRRRFGDLLEEYDEDSELAQLKVFAPRLQMFVVDVVSWIHSRLQANKLIFVEGANAFMLDLDYGTYPFVTSSNACLGGVLTGLAISPFQIGRVIGVTKAYLTRVGSAPFPTEQTNETGEHLQTVGREFGVTTGQKRRCGWLDLVMLKHSAMINHYTRYALTGNPTTIQFQTNGGHVSLNLTKIDVLDGLSTIKVAIVYSLPDGREFTTFPDDLQILIKAEPIYKSFSGWSQPTTDCTSYEQLPRQAKDYIEFIENFGEVKIDSIGCGPARNNLIFR